MTNELAQGVALNPWADPVVWAQIAAAVGALLAVVVALFGHQLRGWIVRPRLDIRIDNSLGELAGEGHWCHLRVSNPHRWSPVLATRVYVLEIQRVRPEGSVLDKWQGKAPIDWRFPTHVGPTLDLGSPWDCDLCVATPDGKLSLKPAIEWGIADRFQTNPAPVHLVLVVQACGLQADSRRLRIRIDWDGEWPVESLIVRKV